MPHGNKKSASQHSACSKKRKKQQQPQQQGSDGVVPVPQSTTSVPIPSSTIPNVQKELEQEEELSKLSSICSQYKYATEQFKLSLIKLVPTSLLFSSSASRTTGTSSKNTSTIGTQQLLDVVDYIHNQVIGKNDSNTFVTVMSRNKSTVTGVKNPDDSNLLNHTGSFPSTFQAPEQQGNTTTLPVNTILIDPQIMVHLKTAISIRRRVMKVFHSGGDKAHQYFYNVLLYCWYTLKPVITYQLLYRSDKEVEDKIGISNRFAAFSINDILDESEINDGDVVQVPSTLSAAQENRQRPSPTTAFENNDDELFTIHAFLFCMDKLMEFIAHRYQEIKKKLRIYEADLGTSFCIREVVMGAIMVNYCLQQVRIMESDIYIQYPYYSSVYRMLIPIISTSLIDDFTELVLAKIPASLKKSYMTRDTIAFMGDVMETGFRSTQDKLSNAEPLVSAFCTKWNISSSTISVFVRRLRMISHIEAPLIYSKTEWQEYENAAQPLGVQPHQILARLKYIGGTDRSIIHTIRLIQDSSHRIIKGTTFYFKRGSFGRQWDERRQIKKITNDMDGLLMYDILPTLVTNCNTGELANNLPREKELLTFFNVLKSFTSATDEPISWVVAFAFHALLTSIFETQGDDDIKHLTAAAKSCYNTYKEQLDKLSTNTSFPPSEKKQRWWKHLTYMRWVRRLPIPAYISDIEFKDGRPTHETVVDRALWNPLCSGLFMEYICYHSNLEHGIKMLDSFAQLRIVLHLYNVLLQAGALKHGDIEFLDWLYDVFKDCKFIWEGPIPIQGEYVKRIYIAIGTSIRIAQIMAHTIHSNVRKMIVDDTSLTPPIELYPLPISQVLELPRSEVRAVATRSPTNISISYCRLCLHDFTNVEDRVYSAEVREAKKGETPYDLIVRWYDTIHHLIQEERLLFSELDIDRVSVVSVYSKIIR